MHSLVYSCIFIILIHDLQGLGCVFCGADIYFFFSRHTGLRNHFQRGIWGLAVPSTRSGHTILVRDCKSRFSQPFRMEMASLLFMPLFRINPRGGVNRDRVSFCGSRKSSELKFAKYHHPLLRNNFLFKCSRTCFNEMDIWQGRRQEGEAHEIYNPSEMKKKILKLQI